MPSSVISQIEIPDGSTCKIKDEVARLIGVYYGECSSSDTAQLKTVTISDFPSAYSDGLKVVIKFTTHQSYNGQPQIKINDLDAIYVCRMGGASALKNEWQAGSVLEFIYVGERWYIIDGQLANGGTPGKVKVSCSPTADNDATSGIVPCTRLINMASNSNLTLQSGCSASVYNFYGVGHTGYIKFSGLKRTSAGSGNTKVAALPSGVTCRWITYGYILYMSNDTPARLEVSTDGYVYVYGIQANRELYGGICFPCNLTY